MIELDVSGELVSAKRSTLMLCAESALARQFDDTMWTRQRDEGGQERGVGGGGGGGSDDDDDDAVFIEQPTYAFLKLIDQLRLIGMGGHDNPPPPPMVAQHEREIFERVVRYYFPGVEDFIMESKLDAAPLSSHHAVEHAASQSPPQATASGGRGRGGKIA